MTVFSSSTPAVSVIMPSFNHEPYVGVAIESVLGQSFDDLELIVVDDCSTDGSPEIIRSYQERDGRVKALYHHKNMGIPTTMNDAIEASTGEYLAFFSSDDEWFNHKLERQLEVLSVEPDVIVWSEGTVIDENGGPLRKTFSEAFPGDKKRKEGDLFKDLLKGNYICGQSVVLRRQLLGSIRYDEEVPLLNDYLVIVQLAHDYEWRFFDEPLVKYRFHGLNATAGNLQAWYADHVRVGMKLLGMYSSELENDSRGDLYSTIGHAYREMGKISNARRFLVHALQLNMDDSSNKSALMDICWSVRCEGNWRLYREEPPSSADQEAQDFGPAPMTSPVENLAAMKRVRSLEKNGNYSEAISCLEQSLKQSPGDVELLTKKGDMLVLLDRHYDALDCYEDAVSSDPRNVRALVNRSVMLAKTGSLYKALESAEAALERSPRDVDALFIRASCLLLLGRLEEAMRCCEAVLEADPGDLGAWSTKGELYCLMDKPAEAVPCFMKVADVYPETADHVTDVAGCLRMLGRTAEALQWYKKAVKIDPRNPVPWLGISACLDALHRCGDAISCCDEALATGNIGAVAWTAKGILQLRAGDLTDALASFESALDLEPDNADALCGKALCLSKSGRSDEALSCLEAALVIDPWGPDPVHGTRAGPEVSRVPDRFQYLVNIFMQSGSRLHPGWPAPGSSPLGTFLWTERRTSRGHMD